MKSDDLLKSNADMIKRVIIRFKLLFLIHVESTDWNTKSTVMSAKNEINDDDFKIAFPIHNNISKCNLFCETDYQCFDPYMLKQVFDPFWCLICYKCNQSR